MDFLNTESFEFYDLQSDPFEGTNLVHRLTAEQRPYYDRLRFWLYGYTTNAELRIVSASWTNGQFSCALIEPGFSLPSDFALWRCENLTTTFWSEVTNVVRTVSGPILGLKDVAPPSNSAFYSVVRR